MSQRIDRLREASRREYLDKRERKKLQELEESIEEDEKRFMQRSPSTKDLEQLQQKRNLLAIAKERLQLELEYSQRDYYSMPKGSVQEENERKSRQDDFQGPLEWENRQYRKSIASSKQTEESYELIEEPSVCDFDEQSVCLEGEFPPKDTNVPLVASQSRQNLPIFAYKEEIIQAVREYQILIMIGETGSGKTTQLPQYLLESGIVASGKKIGCTQPRRVAAMSVARRVSEEMDVQLGKEVGYSIRFEDCTSERTVIKYMTDGILLREFMLEPDLSSYSCIIIDEAHERTVHTDVLFGLIKDIARYRTDLKVIISSATLEAEKFSSFFDDAPIFRVPGRRFPVDIYYTKEPEPDYMTAIVSTVFQIHLTQEAGDILVFLSGQEEIETLQERITLLAGTRKMPELLILPIYSALPADMQAEIFQPTPEGSRKVVLATNIAETSITIDGISFVIDPGFVKQKNFNPKTGMESLTPQPCSRASADQRAGRAGRVGPGKCFRLYTKWSFENELPASTAPEILRTNLANVVLSLKSIGVDDLVHFDFMDPPSSTSLMQALNLLYAMGAFDSDGNLSPIGKKMAEFPLDPMISKMIIASEQFGCTQECLSIAAMLQIQNSIFYAPRAKRQEAEKARKAFWNLSGDHLTMLNVWNQWVTAGYSSQWCFENFIQVRSMRRAKEVREQLSLILERVEISPSSCPDETGICKAVASGFFYNSARLSIAGDSYRLSKNMSQTVYIHPWSVFFGSEKTPPKWIIYYELVQTTKEYLRQVLEVKPEWLTEVAPHYFSLQDVQQIDSKLYNKKPLARGKPPEK